jgi:hypothetical protein
VLVDHSLFPRRSVQDTSEIDCWMKSASHWEMDLGLSFGMFAHSKGKGKMMKRTEWARMSQICWEYSWAGWTSEILEEDPAGALMNDKS